MVDGGRGPVRNDDLNAGRRSDPGAPSPDVPLVRTEGKVYANGAVWSVDQMLRDPHLHRELRDDIAREAEVAYGLEPSLYFYVGHACPAFAAEANAWVFVFAAETFDSASGTMTPFDTGGLYCKKIHLDRDVDLADYVAAHRLDTLAGWRDRFRAYVAEYFPSVRAYVLGKERATKADPYGRLLHPRNVDPRAWTWEMQLHADHDVRVGLIRLWLLHDHMALLKRRIREQSEGERKRWQDALRGDCLRTPSAVPTESNHDAVCRMAREEIASWM